MVIEVVPDDELMKVLEGERKGRRDDYPIRAVWNSILAGIVYQHASIESLRRELLRNGELREACGFDPALGERAVPSKDAYSSLLKKLMKKQDMIDRMFEELIEELKEYLPELGRHLSIDSKKIESYAGGRKNPEESSDPDADWGYKTYKGKRADGSIWEKISSWFGYKLHLLVDTTYELPVGYKVTKATRADIEEMLPMVGEAKQKHFQSIETLAGDKAYDSGPHNEILYDKEGIKPVIDIRNNWKDGEETKLLKPEKTDNVVYDYKGTVYCHCPASNERYEMAFCGFEKDRNTLKYKCPSAAYGMQCRGYAQCWKETKGKTVRIPLDTDRRIFVPIARSSYKWQRIYNGRTAVERVNSRIDLSFGFEHHFVRGKTKTTLRVGLALMVMLSMALARIRRDQFEDMRSLIKRAA
ncbi:MAG: transposase [Nitrospirae bacterium]|nr:transposase [Nitrospirota bacterium]MCL5422143.1 transposase [Nitrospirota bacterium]